MELEGRKGSVDTGKSSRTWSVPTVSLRLAVLNVLEGFFGPKMAVFGPKVQFLKLRSATCESRSRPPPLSLLLKLCVINSKQHGEQNSGPCDPTVGGKQPTLRPCMMLQFHPHGPGDWAILAQRAPIHKRSGTGVGITIFFYCFRNAEAAECEGETWDCRI